MDVISHPAFTELHRCDNARSPEHAGRLRVLHAAFPGYEHGTPASSEEVWRVHSRGYVAAIEDYEGRTLRQAN